MNQSLNSTLIVMTLVVSLVFAGTAPAFAQSRIVPRGTVLNLILDTSLDSEDAQVGDKFTATVAKDVVEDGITVIRRGVTVSGRVTQVEDADRLAGLSDKASMTLRFERLTANGRSWPISATLVSVHDRVEGLTDEDIKRDDDDDDDDDRDIDEEGRVEAETDLGDIFTKGAIGVGAGALLGALFGNVSRGLILGSIGSAVAILAPEGEEVELEQGAGLRIRLDRDLKISIT
jgi:hypothetical protein